MSTTTLSAILFAVAAAFFALGLWLKRPKRPLTAKEDDELEDFVRRREDFKNSVLGSVSLTRDEENRARDLWDRRALVRRRQNWAFGFHVICFALALAGLLVFINGSVEKVRTDVVNLTTDRENTHNTLNLHDQSLQGLASDIKTVGDDMTNRFSKIDKFIAEKAVKKEDLAAAVKVHVDSREFITRDDFTEAMKNVAKKSELAEIHTAVLNANKNSETALKSSGETKNELKTATTNLQTEISGVKTRAERMGSSLATQYTNVLAELRAEKLAREQAFAARSQSASRDAVGVVPTFIAGQPGKLGDTNGRPSLPRRVVSAASSLAHYDYPMVVAAMPANTNVWKAGTLLRGSQARRFKINGGWGNGKERAVAVDYGLFVKAEADVADNTVQSVTEEVVNRFHNHHGKTFAEGAIDRLSRETEINFLEKVRPYFDKVVTSRGMTNTLSLDNVSYTIL